MKSIKTNEKPINVKAAIPEYRDLLKNDNISNTLNEKESECPICIETFIEVNFYFYIYIHFIR
jgi:hypothetical protein